MILVLLAEGFEEIEALTPVDILRRAGFDVRTAAVGKAPLGGRIVTGSHGIPVTADARAEDFVSGGSAPEVVILPGGMPGAKNLDGDPAVDAILKNAAEDGNCILAAICAAPMVLGRRGLLEGVRATCYPGFENELRGATVLSARTDEGRTVCDGRFVTACGMGAAAEFALALVKKLKGEDAAEELRAAVLAK